MTSLPPSTLPPLADWENFYVIMGSAAAGLTGLQFVVIALGADTRQAGDSAAVRVFATPTVVHFCAVLLLAGLMTRPGHTVASLATSALAGGRVRRLARRAGATPAALRAGPVRLDLAHVAAAGRVRGPARRRPAPRAADIGIHNAWDSAVWMTAKRTES